MLDRGPCPPGKYITHPAECKRAADVLGMKYDVDPLAGHSDQLAPDTQCAITRLSRDFRRGCNYNGKSFPPPRPDVVYFNRFGGLFYFYFLIGQVWWTFLFLFFIGQVGWTWTTDRRSLSKYLQMLTEEIQKENIKYIYKIPSQMEV